MNATKDYAFDGTHFNRERGRARNVLYEGLAIPRSIAASRSEWPGIPSTPDLLELNSCSNSTGPERCADGPS